MIVKLNTFNFLLSPGPNNLGLESYKRHYWKSVKIHFPIFAQIPAWRSI